MSQQQLSEEELKNMSPEQIKELQKQNCPFCLINKGQIPAKKVYEDDKCLAVLDINPANTGHIVLYPKEHEFLMPNMKEDIIAHLGIIAKKLSNSLLKAFKEKKVEGTNIFIANGQIAGQKAPHVLIHIIPRSSDDGINIFKLQKKKMSENDLASLQKILAGKKIPDTKTEEKPKPAEKPVEIKSPEPEKKKTKSNTDLDTISNLLNTPSKEKKEPKKEKEEVNEEKDKSSESDPKSKISDKPKKEEKKSSSGIDLDSIANVIGK